MSTLTVGVLALQGDFAKHQEHLASLGAKTSPIRRAQDLETVQGLVIPGGESTVLLKLADEELRQMIKTKLASGLPALATCAGVILLAKNVKNPEQESLDTIDIDVTRNAYGRQIDSFIEPALSFTNDAIASLKKHGANSVNGEKGKNEFLKNISQNEQAATFEGVFIRAPKITRVGQNVSVLIKHGEDPVLVQQGNILAATFHPELSPNNRVIHSLFLSFL